MFRKTKKPGYQCLNYWYIGARYQRGNQPESSLPPDQVPTLEKLQKAMRTTAQARFAASVRLKQKSKAYFFTSTLFSLGLILISLLQIAGVTGALQNSDISAMTTFLAVAVLVYSVTAGTAHYEVRSEQLNECGDKIMNLIRSLNLSIEFSKTVSESVIAECQFRYHLIVTDTEPHSRNDYRRVMLDRKPEERALPFSQSTENAKYYFFRGLEFLPHIALLSLEALFFLEMLGYTNVIVRLRGLGGLL